MDWKLLYLVGMFKWCLKFICWVLIMALHVRDVGVCVRCLERLKFFWILNRTNDCPFITVDCHLCIWVGSRLKRSTGIEGS